MFFPNFSHHAPSRNQICNPHLLALKIVVATVRSRQPPNPAHDLVNLLTVSTSSSSSPSRSLRELLLIRISDSQVGDDEFGYMLADILKQNNVNSSGVRYDSNARTALAFVTLRADGRREFLFFVIQVLICFFKNQNLIKTSLSSPWKRTRRNWKQLKHTRRNWKSTTTPLQQPQMTTGNHRRNWWRREKSTPPTTPLQEPRICQSNEE